MIIKNGLIYKKNKTFVKKDLYIENNIIIGDSHMDDKTIKKLEDKTIIDAEGLYVIPGLIDIHSHGAMGEDFSDGNPESMEKILAYEYSNGITSYCPTTMSIEPDKLMKTLHTVRDWKNLPQHAEPVGINMEGPFLDPLKKGAHRENCLMRPDVDFFQKCYIESGKKIKLVTIAPNLENSYEFIEALREEVVISLGHTSADYEETKRALTSGASHITHLFNAMNSMEHRNPGPIPAAADSQNCYAELICDGIHVHPAMIKAAFSLFKDRIVLISDSMRATGMKEGCYELGGQMVSVKKLPLSDDKGNPDNPVINYVATLEDGTIAGSVSNLFDCMKYVISIGIPVEEAIASATMNPAKSIGIFNTVGSLDVGKKAHILLLDKQFNLRKVL